MTMRMKMMIVQKHVMVGMTMTMTMTIMMMVARVGEESWLGTRPREAREGAVAGGFGGMH